jgi:outer membrane protein
MKKFRLLSISLLLMAVPIFASESRVAHVDSKLIFEKYRKTSDAQVEYDRKLALWEQEANLLQKKVTHLRERIEQQALMLSVEKRKELEAELAIKETELQHFINRIYGDKGELVQENAKISTPIIKEIRRIINEVALQEGYDIVLDRASGAVIFWKNEDDLTQRVLDILNGN